MRRPITAQERIAARYIPVGYTEYRKEGSVIIYANENRTAGIAYRGTAMHFVWFTDFRTKDGLDHAVEYLFRNEKATQEWKKQRRENRQKGETDTQKVKKALKEAGYNVKSVRRDTGTASNWIIVVIDDYDEYVNERGTLSRRYQDVHWIAQVASGREDLHDDISTDLFMVNINVEFTKHHRCSECVISNCDRYHTPESCACGGFYNEEMVKINYAIWSAPVFPPYVNPSMIPVLEEMI